MARKKRILLVDDDDMLREVAEACLQLLDWEVFTANSGAQALKVVDERKPDALVLDVMMPEMDGPGVLAVLRSKPETSRLPVIFLTAKGRPAEQDRLRGLGVCGVLAKPFEPLLLASQVAELLGWSVPPAP